MSPHDRHVDRQYEVLLECILEKGTRKPDRTGTGTWSIFGPQLEYDLSNGFPLITTKRVGLRIVAEELFWFLRGERNIRPLLEKNVHIWSEWPFVAYLKRTDQSIPLVNSDEWREKLASFEARVLDDEVFAREHGDLGPVYGHQWRSWSAPDGQTIDQIQNVLNTLQNNPDSRRMIVSAWNPADLAYMALEPCHVLFQFYAADGKLSCKLTQRSADMFLGVPFNIASYALLVHMIAQQLGLEVGSLIWSGGDCHIYSNHEDAVRTQLGREPYLFPTLNLRKANSLFSYTFADVKLTDYLCHPAIKAPVAV